MTEKLIAHSVIGRYKKLFPLLKLVLYTNLSSYQGFISLYQTATTQYWTCNGPNRQLHVGRSADQRRWHRTLDSGRMDPAHYEVQQKSSYCDVKFSYRPVNNTNRDKSWNGIHSVVSFRLDCFAVLWTG